MLFHVTMRNYVVDRVVIVSQPSIRWRNSSGLSRGPRSSQKPFKGREKKGGKGNRWKGLHNCGLGDRGGRPCVEIGEGRKRIFLWRVQKEPVLLANSLVLAQ